MDKERKQDLNPSNEDIEEKIRQMLDPALPDEPVVREPQEPAVIQSISAPVANTEATTVPSAPPLSDAKKSPKTKKTTPKPTIQPPSKKSKKVIIPVDHDETLPEDPKPKAPAAKKSKTIKKIMIADHDTTPDEVAEKLDEAIAELDAPDTPIETAVPLTAPELETPGPTTSEPSEVQPVEKAVPTAKKATASKTVPETDIPIKDPAVITDPATDKAVAEIVAAEGDELLAVEDAKRAKQQPVQPKPTKKPKKGRLKKVLRKLLLVGLPFALLVAMIFPTSRYAILNQAGVRASSSLTVIDDNTRQPLKNASVELGNASGTTDDEGKVTIQNVRLGKNKLYIQKRGFAAIDRTVITGWGSNPLGDIGMKHTGTQYSFVVTDFLSGKPVTRVAASTNEADARGDDKGIIKLSIEHAGEADIEVTFKRDGYRDETVAIDPEDTAERTIQLVPARKHVYVSKKSGTFDVYSSYLDGKDEQIVLAGSGKERDDVVLAPHPTANTVAFVATRSGETNKQGVTLNNLLLLDLSTNETTSVTASEQIRLINWSGDRLIFVQMTKDASSDSADRFRLMSYNYRDGSTKELAKANFFNDVLGIGNVVYYAVSSAYQEGSAKLYRSNADGTNNEVVYNQEVWNIIRTSYSHLALSMQQEWFDLSIGNKTPNKINAAPPDQTSRIYVDSPSGKHSVWIDNRDGRGVLLVYDTATKIDKELQSLGGITYPVRWLNDSVIVYRVRTGQETADYAINIDGGEPVKISDVTNTAGLFRWLY